ncbi:MAG: ribonuclease P protein component [Candidatus Paceibacterota bacterium]
MFPRNRRVTTAFFKNKKNGGRRLSSTSFSFSYYPQEGVSPSRFAVITSKKIYNTAVGRNGLKRKVFGVLQELLPLLPAHGVVLIYPTKKALLLDSSAIKAEIKNILQTISG